MFSLLGYVSLVEVKEENQGSHKLGRGSHIFSANGGDSSTQHQIATGGRCLEASCNANSEALCM